jgi:hypothetical protein
VVAIARLDIRTRKGGVNNVRIRLDPAHRQLGPYLLSRSVRELVGQSAGRRIAFSQPDWGKPLIEAALDLGFTLRNEWHQMGLLLL